MTEKYYLDDSYLFEFTGRIRDIRKKDAGYEIILDATAFYPESGGQLCDTGHLDARQVINVFENDAGDIVHVCPDWSAPVDSEVTGRIDRERRLDNMRKHTGQHILTQSLIQTVKAKTVSSHLGDEESTIELSIDSITDDDIFESEKLANDTVMQNLPVKISYHERSELEKLGVRKIPERRGRYRIVQVGDFDCTACGGTHCRRTGEVGPIKIISQEKIRGHIRVTFLTGRQAIIDYHRKHDVVSRLSSRLTCHFTDIEDSFEKIAAQTGELKKEVGRLHRELTPVEIERLKSSAIDAAGFRIITAVYRNQDFKYLRELGQELVQSDKIFALFMADDRLLISVSEGIKPDASELAKIFIDKYEGRGGGNPAVAQVGGITDGKQETYLNEFAGFIRDEFGG